MREAAVPGYRLSRSKRSTRVLVTMGMLGLLLGLLTSIFMATVRTGLAPSSVRNYYLGTEGEASKSELDTMLTSSQRRPFAELVEVTHLHILGGSMLLFLLCHLLSICDIRDDLRTLLYVTSFSSFLLTFTLPWLLIYLHPGFSYLYGPSIIILVCTLTALTLIPLWEMWGPRRDPEVWNDGRL